MFTNKDLRRMIVPLLIEQFLVMFVGMADTFVVSYAGDAAVSGVTLVNSFNTVFSFLFTALASGGAVVVSQYIGNKDTEKADNAAGQLLMFSALFSVVCAALVLVFDKALLNLMFGQVEADVMDACVVYLRISAYSYPALAVYSAGAALCRSNGKTNVTMYVSVLANVVNVIGNLVGVFVLHLGVAGVAYPSLISRALSAIIITAYCFGNSNSVRFRCKDVFAWNGSLLKKVLGIAVPNGVESGVHQLVKVALSSLVAGFGTYQIAANGVAQSIWTFAAMMGLAMCPVFTTVIGQCMGAGDIGAANFYFKKLTKLTFILSVAWNAAIFALTPLILCFYSLTDEVKELVIILVLINNVMSGIAYPFAGPLGNGLRAAGDVTYTMVSSVVLTIFARLFFSVVFGLWLSWGVIGIAFGMGIDLFIRGAMFLWRYKPQKWATFKVI